jgi:hypothetical protein
MDTRQIAKTFKFTVDKVLECEIPVSDWKFSFRASMIPMCQYDLLFSYMLADQIKNYPKHFSFMQDYFVSVGTTVHTVLQRWLGRAGILYGRWKCPRCSKTYEQQGVAFCKNCNKTETGIECTYEEYDLSPGTPFCSVHPDGLLVVNGLDGLVLTDIKTTSLANIPKLAKEGLTKEYQLNYLLQTSIYKHLLSSTPWNFDIVATVLLFVPRDNPTRWLPLAFKQKNVASIYDTAIAEYTEATYALERGDFAKIDGLCSDVRAAKFRDCPFVDFCFSRTTKREVLVQELYQEWKNTGSKNTSA